MSNIGARILNIITESLYSNPEVVFREYVQNSIDSFQRDKSVDHNVYKSKIYVDRDDLIFLDNGKGIESKFEEEMSGIAISYKRPRYNIGYKGIGRLSGISYCKKLKFVNIRSFSEHKYQIYSIDCELYSDIRKTDDYYEMSFEKLMNEIGNIEKDDDPQLNQRINDVLESHREMFSIQDTGFMVMMISITPLLKEALDKKINDTLGWMLPVQYKEELLSLDDHNRNMKGLLKSFKDEELVRSALIEYDVRYNGLSVKRPITKDMLRDYVCIKRFGSYAIGFHSFRADKFIIEKNNPFQGIRLYIDNMLLCNEEILIPALIQYGYLEHTVNETIQAVRTIGAMIYIIDKVNLAANAKRSFIEVTDQDSLNFLKILAEFVEQIYEARYALSRFRNAHDGLEGASKEIENKRVEAENKLKILAGEEISIPDTVLGDNDFKKSSIQEQKKRAKKIITTKINTDIKNYLEQVEAFNDNSIYEDFLLWVEANHKR